MPPPARRTAYETTYPSEAGANLTVPASTASGTRRKDSPTYGSAAQRNKRSKSELIRTRRNGPPASGFYAPQQGETKESKDTVIFGEDPDERFDAEGKPVRYLTQFEVFEPKSKFALASLHVLNSTNAAGRHIECAGFVSPVPLNEEDAGQEDEDEIDQVQQRLRTSAVVRFSVDYTRMDESPQLETAFGWYALKCPAKSYKKLFVDFYRRHRVAQIAVSVALEGVLVTFDEFNDLYVDRRDDLLGDVIIMQDLQDAVPIICALLDDKTMFQDVVSVSSHPIIQHLLTTVGHAPQTHQVPRGLRIRTTHHRPVNWSGITGNLDLAVLRPENHTRTCVTPLIASLAEGLFYERLQVVGPPPKKPSNHELKRRKQGVRAQLLEMLCRASSDQKSKIFFPANQQLYEEYWNVVCIDGETFKVGDCVIFEAGAYKNRRSPELPTSDQIPEHASLADYFWFAKIININQQFRRLHIQWYEHSSKTYLQEISNPQELFLCPICDDIDLNGPKVLGKIVVRDEPDGLGATDFFSRFMYNETDGSFLDLEDKDLGSVRSAYPPPDNCAACLVAAQNQADSSCSHIENGISYLGILYHVDDYALLRAEKGAAEIGRILHIKNRRDHSPIFKVQLLGRTADVCHAFPTRHQFADERELFTTDMQRDVDAKDLVQRCVVLHQRSVEDLRSWLTLSPNHFFVKYHFPSLQAIWSTRTKLEPCKVPVCMPCYEESKEPRLSRRTVLRAFDPFAGVGAFATAMEESKCVKLTHAVEISPSAADTLKLNCPSVQVYNQCSNTVLQYAVKTDAGQTVTRPRDVRDKTNLPPPPLPGQIDCIIAGFPCQPHSTMNIFQRANDRKSHLMLNLLSWVDFLRPKYCFFENVKGFLQYNLLATQAGRHRVEGGIPMGGLKFFVNAMLAMGYQIREGLLEAGHYGTPQGRIRFFSIASQRTYPLPLLPQPSHSSLNNHSLEIKFPNGITIRPILTADGTAPLRHVTVGDSVDDLVAFDWENPRKLSKSTQMFADRDIVTVKCDKSQAYCGPSGNYSSPPMNSYQAKSREKPTTNIQHYTRVPKAETVERVVNVPLRPNADYRDFGPELQEWFNSNPSSAVARLGFRPGFYGRLDKNGWFHTTVTNVEPTAKQSYVIHHACLRVVSVRELARSQGFPDRFVFCALGDRVKTMQRQIGNAVPWPVARALGRELYKSMLKREAQNRLHAEMIDDI